MNSVLDWRYAVGGYFANVYGNAWYWPGVAGKAEISFEMGDRYNFHVGAPPALKGTLPADKLVQLHQYGWADEYDRDGGTKHISIKNLSNVTFQDVQDMLK